MFFYIIVWAAQQLRSKVYYPKIDKLLLISIFALSISAILSFIVNQSITLNNFASLKPYLRLLLIPIMIPAFVTHQQKAFAINIFIASTAINILVIYSKLLGIIPLESFAPGITQGFKDSIFTSLAMALSLFFCLNIIADEKVTIAKKTFYFLLSVIFFHYLYFLATGRTGQILGIILILILALKHIFSKNIVFSTTILIALSSVVFFNSSFENRIKISLSEAQNYIYKPKGELAQSDSSLGLRSEWAKNAFSLFTKKPVFGFGVGNFESSYSKYFPERKIRYGEIVDNPHNQYLLISVEMGTLGLVLYLLFITSILRVNHIDADKKYQIMTAGAMISLLIGCLANSWLKDHTSSIIFITLISALLPITTKAARSS